MYLYKAEDRYDTKTGKKISTKYEQCGVICDFTGEYAEFFEELGPTFEIDYNSIDSNAGCGEGEFEFAKKYKVDIYVFLFDAPFSFKEEEINGLTVMERILKTAKTEGFDNMYFDQLFRWCRIRTADKLLTEG